MTITNVRRWPANWTLRQSLRFLLLVSIPALLPLALRAQTPPVPFIQSVIPQSATPGETTPGQTGLQLTIIGTGFVPANASTPASVLKSVYSAAAGASVPLTTSCTSSTTCTATLPQALQGTFILTMVNSFPPLPSPPPSPLPPVAFYSNAALFTVAPSSGAAFSNFPSNAAGTAPVAIATGDFNDDGKTDLAVVNSGDDTVTILLSKGDGTFMDPSGNPCGLEATAPAPPLPSPKPCPTYPTGHNPVAITAGKFNLNNNVELDLVIADQNDNDLTVLLGNGDGTFTVPTTSPCATLTKNSNGQVTSTPTSCSNFLGVAPFALAAGGSATNPVSGANGELLFVLNQQDSNCGTMSPTPPSLSVLISNNDGTFSTLLTQTHNIGGNGHVCLDSQFNPSAMVLGDFNNDGFVDIAIAARGIPKAPSTNNPFPGQDAFPSVPICPTGSGTMDVADGFSLIQTNSLLMNSFCSGPSPSSIAAGDFTGGNLDLVVTNTGAGTVSVLTNTCTSASNSPCPPAAIFTPFSFGNPVSYATGTRNATYVVVGDFDSDGLLDIVVADQGASAVSVLQNNEIAIAACAFLNCTTPPPLFSLTAVTPTQDANGVGQAPAALVALDINGDGKLDLATANNHDNSVSLLVQGVSLTIACASGTNTAGPPPPACLGTPPSPPTLSFGNVPVSNPLTKVGPLTVTVSNNGTASLTLTGLTISDAINFSLDGATTCTSFPLMLSSGSTCNVAVDLAPSTLGPLSAAVQITFSSGPLPIAQSFTVTGTGVAPAVQFSPPSFAFGQQLAGTASAAQTITLQNIGDPMSMFTVSQVCVPQVVLIPPITIPNPNFQLVGQNSNGCLTPAMSLSGGAGFAFGVNFTPKSSGSLTAQLNITVSFMGVNYPLTYALSGQGIAPIVSLSGAQLTFANQQVGTTSPIEMVTLTNLGIGSNLFPADLTIGGISTSNSDFQVVQIPAIQLPSGINNCPNSGPLVVGASCVVGITFTPGFVPGPGLAARTAALAFTDNNNAKNGSIQSVALSGTATFPVVSLSVPLAPAVGLALGGVPVTTKGVPMSFTLANMGTAPLSLYGIADSDSTEFIESDNCPRAPMPPTIPTAAQQLAINTFCTVTIVFAPSATAGPRNATLTFSDDNFGSYNTMTLTQVVNLTGTGTDFTLSVAPTSITIAPSKTATYTITLNPIDGFNNPVSFNCAGGPPHSNCFISGMSNGSASVILSTSQGVNHGTFTLTFTATYTAVPPAAGTLSHSVQASLTIK